MTYDDDARLRGAAVLRALKNYRGVSDADLAEAIGVSRSKVNSYTSGVCQLTLSLMCDFAYVLDVDPSIFFDTPDEALRLTIEHKPNGKGFRLRSNPPTGSRRPRQLTRCYDRPVAA